jgi:hypothetical protein
MPKRNFDAITATVVNQAITATVVNQAITATVVNLIAKEALAFRALVWKVTWWVATREMYRYNIQKYFALVNRQSAVMQAIEEIDQARRARDPNQCLAKRP